MSEKGTSLQYSGAWGAAAFGTTLAIIIGLRLDQAALAAMVGVICGIGASIPTSLLIVTLLRMRDEGRLWSPEHSRRREAQSTGRKVRGARWMAQNQWGEARQPPPVVVVTTPSVPQVQQSTTWPGEYAAPLPAQRQFSIIGEEETLYE